MSISRILSSKRFKKSPKRPRRRLSLSPVTNSEHYKYLKYAAWPSASNYRRDRTGCVLVIPSFMGRYRITFATEEYCPLSGYLSCTPLVLWLRISLSDLFLLFHSKARAEHPSVLSCLKHQREVKFRARTLPRQRRRNFQEHQMSFSPAQRPPYEG